MLIRNGEEVMDDDLCCGESLTACYLARNSQRETHQINGRIEAVGGRAPTGD